MQGLPLSAGDSTRMQPLYFFVHIPSSGMRYVVMYVCVSVCICEYNVCVSVCIHTCLYVCIFMHVIYVCVYVCVFQLKKHIDRTCELKQ